MTTAAYEFRTATIADLAKYPLLQRIINQNQVPYVFDQMINMEAPDAEAEVRSGFTTVLDGTTTAVKVRVVSASADDAGSGTGIRTVGLFGISATSATGTFSLYEETLTMTGTDAVTTTRYYKRIIGIRAITAGAGLVAAGAITCHEVGGTSSTYATIAIGTVCGVNARFYGITGKNFAVLALGIAYSAGTAAKLATVRVNYSDSVLVDAAAGNNSFASGDQYQGMFLEKTIAGNDTKYVTLNHVSLDTSNNVTGSYHFVIAIW